MNTLPRAYTGTATFSMKQVLPAIPLLPRNALIALMTGYRAVISPIYGDVCKFYPTCSAYAVGSFQQYGAVLGLFRTIRRLTRCHPWALGGIDDVPVRINLRYGLTPSGFVTPVSGERNDS